MSEQGTEFDPPINQDDDVEGHRHHQVEGPDDDDVEGHRHHQVEGSDDDDVEGHVQPPRGDDTDHVHSINRE
ncbi:hypothetical protein [Nocardioides sp.]|uniref:hypothetical protein n=1 Tax=Nocardioides sp. TaxID=35761 RepID=UPI002F41F047